MIDTLIRAVVIGISVQVGRQLVTGRHSAPGWYSTRGGNTPGATGTAEPGQAGSLANEFGCDL